MLYQKKNGAAKATGHRSSVKKFSAEKLLLKISSNFQENMPRRFLLNNLLIKDLTTHDFLLLRVSLKQLPYKTSLKDCFWILMASTWSVATLRISTFLMLTIVYSLLTLNIYLPERLYSFILSIMQVHYITFFLRIFSEDPVSELAQLLCFAAYISVGGASWTLDPSKEAVNCNIKHKNDMFAV